MKFADTNTALSTDDIADSLTEIFDFISSGNATWDSIESMGNALGKEIVYNIKQEIDSENQHMYKNALETKIENGYTKAEAEEKLRQKLKSHYKNEYINNNAKRSEIETSLKETGLFNDDDFKD